MYRAGGWCPSTRELVLTSAANTLQIFGLGTARPHGSAVPPTLCHVVQKLILLRVGKGLIWCETTS